MDIPLEGLIAYPAMVVPLTSGTTPAAEVAGPIATPGDVVGRAVDS